MKPWSTPSPGRPETPPLLRGRLRGALRGTLRLSVAGLLALAATACVSTDSYERLLDERDQVLAERRELARRVAELEAHTRRLEAQQERMEASNASLSAERVELIADVEELRAEQERLQGEVGHLAQDRESLGSELAKREGQLEEREEQLEARSRELEALSRKLETRTAELEARTQELRQRDAELQELKVAYEEFVGDLESEIADGQIMIDQLREGVRVNLPDAQFFKADSVELTMHGKVTLAKVAAQLRPMAHHVEVQGHTDDLPVTGSLAERYPSSWDVAAARASAVVRQLVAHGIAPERIRAVSYGSSRPVAPNDTEEDRARNRRIEIRLIPVHAVEPSLAASLPRAAPRRVPGSEGDEKPSDR